MSRHRSRGEAFHDPLETGKCLAPPFPQTPIPNGRGVLRYASLLRFGQKPEHSTHLCQRQQPDTQHPIPPDL